APHERIAGFVHVGTALERPMERVRPPLSEVVTRLS
ncbi:MAG TPA: nitroreductase, partial [Microvirga sp.]|nr:nitroreductase [Microvirga sp.]